MDTLNYLKMVYFKHKQVSVAEATYRLLRSLTLKKSNIACTYLATGFVENRFTFFRKAVSKENASVNENAEGDEKVNFEENKNNQVTFAGREGKFQEVDTIHKRYSERPEELNYMCFTLEALFIQHVPKVEKQNGQNSRDEMDEIKNS